MHSPHLELVTHEKAIAMWHRLRVIYAMGICSTMLFASADEKSEQQIEPVQSWSGINQDSGLMREGPRMEFVSDPESWKILWKLWTRNADVPEVDFERHFVLVGAMPGPNKVDLLPSHIIDGDLRFTPMGTLKGGRGFGYKFHVVERTGIKSVNGISIHGSGYTNVTIVGVLKSNLVVNDGESTRSTITSRGMTWELVFKQRSLAGEAVERPWGENNIDQLDGKTVYLIGSLVPGMEGQANNSCRIMVDYLTAFPP